MHAQLLSFPRFFYLYVCALALQVTARAKYSIAYDGTLPDLYLPNFEHGPIDTAKDGPVSTTSSAQLPKRSWKLFIPNAYHPLLLQQHQENLRRTKKDVASATSVSFPRPILFYYVYANIYSLIARLHFYTINILYVDSKTSYLDAIFYLSTCGYPVLIFLPCYRRFGGGGYMDKILQRKIN
jgi:hypothetical protein